MCIKFYDFPSRNGNFLEYTSCMIITIGDLYRNLDHRLQTDPRSTQFSKKLLTPSLRLLCKLDYDDVREMDKELANNSNPFFFFFFFFFFVDGVSSRPARFSLVSLRDGFGFIMF